MFFNQTNLISFDTDWIGSDCDNQFELLRIRIETILEIWIDTQLYQMFQVKHPI